MNILLGMLLSLMPKRLRFRLHWSETEITRGAFWSGVVECVLCLGVFCFRYLWFLQYRVGEFADQLIHRGAESTMGATSVQFGAGTVTLGEYLIQPLSIALGYFAIEGAVRWIAALIHGEVLPTLPLQLISWGGLGIERGRHQAWLGEKVADEVLVGSGQDFALRIASCRPKAWNGLTTISYQDQLFEMFQEEVAEPPRRFVYLLRKAPASKVVRGLYEYDPEEVLRS